MFVVALRSRLGTRNWVSVADWKAIFALSLMALLDLEAATRSMTTVVAVLRRLCMNASAGSPSESESSTISLSFSSMRNDKVCKKRKQVSHRASLGRFRIGWKVLTNLSDICEGWFLGSSGSAGIRGEGCLVTLSGAVL